MAGKMKKVIKYICIVMNLLVVMAMLVCAYSAYLPPQNYPNWSYFGMAFPVALAANVVFLIGWLIFKWKMAAIPAVGMLCCIGAIRTYCPINFPLSAPEGSVKILTYNTMHWGEKKNVPAEENEIVLYLQNSDADILCLQEIGLSKMDPLLDALKEKYPYRQIANVSENMQGVLSKYPISEGVRINYNSATNYSFAYDVYIGEDTLVVINNHLESYKLTKEDKEEYKSVIKHPNDRFGDKEVSALTDKIKKADVIRAAQADSLAAFVEKNEGRYIVMCGDFNSSSISYVHHRLTRKLNDAFTRSGNGFGISYNRNGMYFRIDHILVSDNISAYEAKVDNSIKASDHYPVTCSVKLEGK